jgi:hypothetical protein
MTDVPRLLVILSDDLTRRGIPGAGLLRRAARLIVELEARTPAPEACACGNVIVQPARGRGRVWCSDRCRVTQWKRIHRL